MKRWIGLVLSVAMVFSLACSVSAAQDDTLMLFDGERMEYVAGDLAALDYDYYTEGSAGLAGQNFGDYLGVFVDTFSYHGNRFYDITEYDYIEFDIMSWFDMVCNFEVCIVNNIISHHGNDMEIFEMYFPAGEFVHFKLPLKDFVVYDEFNMDSWDVYRDFIPDEEHYGGYALDRVARLRWQMSRCTFTDRELTPCDEIYMVFDNVTVTKNGAGEESTYLMWEDVKDTYYDSPQPVVSGTDVTPTEVNPGDVDNNGTVNAGDALLALKFAVGKEELTPLQKQAADMDANGVINAADALTMLKIAVGKA